MARGPTLVPIAPELEREARAGQQLAQPPSDGMGEAFGAVAKQFGTFATEVGKLADHAAKTEGEIDGHLAGMDPEFRPRRDGTIRGEAFDRAALDTAKARSAVDIHNEIEAAALKHRANPQALQKVLAEKQKAWEGQAPPDLLPEIRNLFAKGATTAFRQATRELWTEQAEAQRGAVQAELERSLRTVQQTAYLGGLDETAVRMAADNVAQLQSTLSKRGPDGRPLVAPATAAKLVADAKEIVTQAQLEGAFDRLPPEAKAEFVKRFDEDFANSRGVAKELDFKTFQRVKGHFESELRRDDARARQAGAALGHFVKEFQSRADKGYAVRPEELAALKARAATADDPEIAAALADAEDSWRFQRSFRTLGLPQMDVEVQNLRRELEAAPSSLTDRGRIRRRLEKAETLLNAARTETAANPLGWDNRTGVIALAPMQAIDWGTPGSAEGWGALRVAQAEDAARRHGLGKPIYLEPDERRSLAKQFEMGGKDGLAVVTRLRQTFGASAEAVIAELGREGQAPAGTLLADLALKLPAAPVVGDAAEGLHLRTVKDFKSRAPDIDEARTAAARVHRGALNLQPAVEAAYVALANAVYDVRAARKGLAEFSDADWRQAFREVMGEHKDVDGTVYGGVTNSRRGTLWGGSAAVLIPTNVRQDRFRDLVDAVTVADFGAKLPRLGDGRPVGDADLRGAALLQAGRNRYWLNVGSDEAPVLLRDGIDRERPAVLDLDQLEGVLRERRPDAYHGGRSAPAARSRPPGMMRLGGPPPIDAPPGAAETATFVGERAGTADTAELDMAKAARAAGQPMAEIWREHGWYQAPDGKWRSEIDDSNAKLTPAAAGLISGESPKGQMTVGDLLQHDDLFAAYPGLAAIPIRFDADASYFGQYEPEIEAFTVAGRALKDPRSLKLTLLHELQHVIQQGEGHAYGFRANAEKYPDIYRRSPGEAEAYDTEVRIDMTAEQRRGAMPFSTLRREDRPSWSSKAPLPPGGAAARMNLGGPGASGDAPAVEAPLPLPDVTGPDDIPEGTPAEVKDGLAELDQKLGLDAEGQKRLRQLLLTDSALETLEQAMQAPNRRTREFYSQRLLDLLERQFKATRK